MKTTYHIIEKTVSSILPGRSRYWVKVLVEIEEERLRQALKGRDFDTVGDEWLETQINGITNEAAFNFAVQRYEIPIRMQLGDTARLMEWGWSITDPIETTKDLIPENSMPTFVTPACVNVWGLDESVSQ
jgi:hypothetical protein